MQVICEFYASFNLIFGDFDSYLKKCKENVAFRCISRNTVICRNRFFCGHSVLWCAMAAYTEMTCKGVMFLVRFRVVKASHLLLVVSILILVGVIAFIALQNPSTPANPALKSAAGRNSTQQYAGAEVAMTSVPASAASGLQITVIPDEVQPEQAIQKPRVLIYHTHTHEAYAQVEHDPYEAIETWRTYDTAHSIVQVGVVLAAELEKRGFEVIHDATDHELDNINQAYVRSLETISGYPEKFDLYIDLHRDAHSKGLKHFITDENGKEYAQMMLLVGRGDAYTGTDKPDYERNLQFAQDLTRTMNDQLADLCRNVTVKKGRYNQHLSSPMILLEAGHNLNTLEEVLSAMPMVAESIAKCI